MGLSREIVLSDVIRGRDELSQSIRLRVAIDALHDLPGEAPLEARSLGSRCRFENIRIDENGRARIIGDGDTSGAQVLLWEILASRAAPDVAELPRVHDVVDEILPDVDDLVARALSLDGDPETIGDLLGALVRDGDSSAGDQDDVIVALALTPPKREASASLPAISLPTFVEPTRDPVDASPEEPAPTRLPTAPPATEPSRGRDEAPVVERVSQVDVELSPVVAPWVAVPSEAPTPAPLIETIDEVAPPMPPRSEAETLSAPAVVEPAKVEEAKAPVVDAASPPESLTGWEFLDAPLPEMPPIAKTVPAPRGKSAAPKPKSNAVNVVSADEVPPSERSWSTGVREDGRAITGMLRQSTDPISQLPPLVLLVKHGEADDGPLCHMLRAAGYGLMLRQDAAAGYHAARQVLPDVVVVDFDLPDETGDRFVRRIRTDASRLAATPIVLITGAEDTRTRIARFATGADVCLSKPFRFADVVAQVAALVKMSARLRSAREALPYVSSAGDKVFQGDLQHISIGAMLTILEMERRTGVFDIRSEGRRAQLEIVAGRMVSGVALDRPLGPLATVRTVLRWGVGRFAFRTIPLRTPPPEAPSISEILTEALRLQDEEDHEDFAPAKT